jgi:hypothetical protein
MNSQPTRDKPVVRLLIISLAMMVLMTNKPPTQYAQVKDKFLKLYEEYVKDRVRKDTSILYRK